MIIIMSTYYSLVTVFKCFMWISLLNLTPNYKVLITMIFY